MNLGQLKSHLVKEQKLLLDYEKGEAYVEVITPQIIRVFCEIEGRERASKAIEDNKKIPVKIRVEEAKNQVWIHTTKLSVRVDSDFLVDFFDEQGKIVCEDYRGERKPLPEFDEEKIALLVGEGHAVKAKDKPVFEVVKKMQGTEHFYGLGDKTGYLDKRYYAYEMWNTDNPAPQVDCFKALYKTIPFFITKTEKQVYGIFMDNHCKSFFNMGQESEDYFYFGAAGGNLNYYYIAGDNLPQVLRNYAYLTGTCPLPQKWTLGYHQSRWGYVTQEDIEDIAQNLRAREIPCDSIHFDIDYMEDYKVFTWNEQNYHGDSASFLQKLAKQGFKPVVIIDPGVKKQEGYAVYEEGRENNYFAKKPEGEIYVNRVWPGEAVFPDFGKEEVRKWWGEKHRFLLEKGVRGIWNDMNEPASFNGPLPYEIVFSDGEEPMEHAKIHNIYGHLMAKAAFEGLKRLDNRRPFLITRACYAGSQKYASAWTGDNHSIWAHLQMAIPQLCNLGLSGMPFVGTDVGGFGSDTTKELLIRWVQLGCFCPLFRNHSAMGSRSQEPWQFGEEAERIYQKYVQLRYRWIRYFYDLFFEGERTGEPILRPLVFHYEQDKTVWTCNDEFMLGDKILAAPVVQQGMTKRMVYLPEGEWYDYWTKERYTGAQWLIREAPLELCPIYIKAGSIIPVMEKMAYIEEGAENSLCLEVYGGNGEYIHYLDNGEDYGYREGRYHKYHFSSDEEGKVKITVLHAGYDRPYKDIMVKKII